MVSYMPQAEMVFDTLTVAENLAVNSNGDIETYELALKAFPVFPHRMDQVAGSMSGGERKLLGFVRTIILEERSCCWMNLQKACSKKILT